MKRAACEHKSEVKEDRLALTLNADIEAIGRLAIDFAALGDQRFAALRLLDQIEHRILGVCLGLVLEIQASIEVDVDAPGEQRDVDVRRHRHAGGVVHHARLDRIGGPLATSIEGGGGTTETVERFGLVVILVVLALVVGLPQLDRKSVV